MTETYADLLLEKIRHQAMKFGLAPSRISKMAGLGVNVLRDMYKPSFNVRFSTLRKVECALDDYEKNSKNNTLSNDVLHEKHT